MNITPVKNLFRHLNMTVKTLMIIGTLLAPTLLHAKTYYVATDGDDNNSGTSIYWPLATVNAALRKAYPGDYIKIAPGAYYQDIKTVRSGTADKPIRIRGNRDPHYKTKQNTTRPVVIHGGGSSRVVQIRHSHIEMSDITIDGLVGPPTKRSSYRDKLLFIHNDENIDGLTNIVIKRLRLSNAGGECIRLRYRITHSTIAYSMIHNCGVYDFKFNEGGKNGEGIYVGTAINQLTDGKNPSTHIDQTWHNTFKANTIHTHGNECIDLKPGTRYNIVKNNICMGNLDGHSAGINSAGNNNRIEGNTVSGHFGAGVRLGSKHTGFGIGNTVIKNKINSNQGPGLKMISLEQADICDNDIRYNRGGIASLPATVKDSCLSF